MRSGPTPPSERNLTLDVLHGMSLLGILLADFPLYAIPLDRLLAPPRAGAASLDALVDAFLFVAVHTKFLTILTLLFGVSLAMLEDRAGDPAAFARPYLRRLAFLFALGALHTVLVWHSILLLYVPCALAAFSLRALPARIMLAAAVGLLLLGALAPPAAAFLCLLLRRLPDPRWMVEHALLLGGTSWTQVAVFRLSQFAFLFAPAAVLLFGLRSVGLMLLGIWLHRRGAFAEDPARAALAARLAGWGLAAGLPLSALAGALAAGRAGSLGGLLGLWLAFYAGGLGLGLGYAGLAGLACLRPRARAALAPLARVGRVCLSGFVLGSILFSLAAYPYGLGLLGKVGPAACAAVSLAVFVLIERLSAWWLARRRFGPLEWLLRAASYGRAPALRAD